MKQTALRFMWLALISSSAFGQALEVYPAQINFGFVTEVAPDSIQITLYNSTRTTFTVDAEKHILPYADDAFRLSPSEVSIPPMDSATAYIVFSPNQNLDYEGELILADDGPGGCAILEVEAHGRFSNSYYNSTEGKSEELLKTALNTLLAQGYVTLSYNAARDEMYANLDNVNGDVECVYTGRTATFNDRTGANANNFNCEHTFPQGFFSQNQPMRSDIHHLFPTDAGTNSRRSNHPFGIVSNPSWTGGGSKYGNSVFEPRDAHKGAAARAMMYFVIRYQDYANFFAPQESILLQWHEQFPPSAFETGRNNDIYAVQNNRNPFVDYPQFADRINNFVANSSADVNFDLQLGNDTIFLPISQSGENGVYIFRTAVVNAGNEPIFVDPQAFATTELNYRGASGNPSTLLPGEVKEIEFTFPYSPSFTAADGITLEILTNLPSGNVVIPIIPTPFALSESESSRTDFEYARPNPASTRFILDERVQNYVLRDIRGRVIDEGVGNEVDLSSFNAGVYLLEYEGKDFSRTERVVVK
ncbi:endonuclease [Phaeocystidibacter luteus]|uniref:T9SS type A sorting domain-containing protein n=1 Tax=Phaeocystidibacter luteus TaxID=911197 RepID=A0A6N6RMF9_9FLAO|nr:endonuclease [Phaeocystidibacter luteus]KAB2814732.1 T9SS type A sorting domain-containing protein [Phaeocystidibacter luteus]